MHKHLLIIHGHGSEYPNTGSLVGALSDYLKRIVGIKRLVHPLPLISIVVEIAFRNPKTYHICAAIVSKFLSFIESDEEKRSIIDRIKHKFSLIPNTGHMQIWLQRISLKFAPDIEFEEPLCGLVAGENCQIWNNEWISSIGMISALDAKRIIMPEKVRDLDAIIPTEEVELFSRPDGYR